MKNIIAITITTAILALAATTGLRAEDPQPTTSTTAGDGGPCEGGCHKGDKKHDKDADKGEKPAPAPSPAQ